MPSEGHFPNIINIPNDTYRTMGRSKWMYSTRILGEPMSVHSGHCTSKRNRPEQCLVDRRVYFVDNESEHVTLCLSQHPTVLSSPLHKCPTSILKTPPLSVGLLGGRTHFPLWKLIGAYPVCLCTTSLPSQPVTGTWQAGLTLPWDS